MKNKIIWCLIILLTIIATCTSPTYSQTQYRCDSVWSKDSIKLTSIDNSHYIITIYPTVGIGRRKKLVGRQFTWNKNGVGRRKIKLTLNN